MSCLCEVQNCNFDTFKQSSMCVLHMQKKNLNSKELNCVAEDFDNKLVSYVIDYLDKREEKTVQSLNDNDLRSYLLENTEVHSFTQIRINDRLRHAITFDHISFPKIDSFTGFNFVEILNKIEKIHFNYCFFECNYFKLEESQTFYQDCTFLNWWNVGKADILANENSVLFQDCEFQEDVSISKQSPLEFSLFNNCKFLKTLELSNQLINSSPFNNTDKVDLKCSKLKIENCRFSAKFLFNNTKFDEVIIKDSIFEEKFEFKENFVDKFEIINSNFKKLFDAYKTKFINFRSFKSIYDDFVGFEKCQFGISEKNSEEKVGSVSSFTYTTFMSFTNFRNTKFNSGLDFKNTNLKEPPNFLNTELDTKFTNRETFRVIKDSFDKIGNHIEANRFFVGEMQKYREELKLKKGWSQEKVIFHLNYLVSDFGSSYVRPIMWILLTLYVFDLLVIGYEKNLLYKVVPIYNQEIAAVTGFLNSIASYALPFKKFLLPGMELISLVFYIIIISLVWQAVNALKRHTKR